MRIVCFVIMKIVVTFRMRTRKAYQKCFGSANCAMRGVNVIKDNRREAFPMIPGQYCKDC